MSFIKSLLLAALVNIFSLRKKGLFYEQQDILLFLTKISVLQERAKSFFFFFSYTCDFKGARYNNEAYAVLRVTAVCPLQEFQKCFAQNQGRNICPYTWQVILIVKWFIWLKEKSPVFISVMYVYLGQDHLKKSQHEY